MKTVQQQVFSTPARNFFSCRPTYQPDLPPFAVVTYAGERVAFGENFPEMDRLCFILNERLYGAESLGIVIVNHIGA